MAKETVDDNLEDLYMRMERAFSKLGQIEDNHELEDDGSVTLGAERKSYVPNVRINRDGMTRYQRFALKQKVAEVLSKVPQLESTPDMVRYATLLVKLKDGPKNIVESYNSSKS